MFDPLREHKNIIKQGIYKLYKAWWLKHHVKPFSFENLYQEYLDYISVVEVNKGIKLINKLTGSYTFEDYIREFGFDKEYNIFVGYDEFLTNEYQDVNIIREIIFKSFNDEETAKAVHLAYLNDILFDKNGKTTFMDVEILEERDELEDYYWCKFYMDGKEYSESNLPDALNRILQVKDK